MPLKLPQDLLFRPAGSAEPLPKDALPDLMALVRKSSGSGDRKDTLETFKKYFATRSGSSYASSSDVGWAGSDLDKYALLASKEAVGFIAAIYDACEELSRSANAVVPSEGDINAILAEHAIGYRIENDCLVRVEAAAVPEIELDEVVSRALADAETLLRSGGDSGCLDGVHTALHDYLRGLCQDEGHQTSNKATTGRLFKDLRKYHPAFIPEGPRSGDISKIQNALATMINVLSPIRNKASLAHANELLDEPEALLVLHAASTVFRYIQDTLSRYQGREST